jgi:hypothetical protein
MKVNRTFHLLAVFTLTVELFGLAVPRFVLMASAASPTVDVQTFGASYGEWSA